MLNICNKISNKSIKILFLNALFVSTLLSSSIKENIYISKLYEHPYWGKLLHYTNGKSEVDSNNFFISKNGKYDKKEELLETIDSLIEGKNNVLCRFPLRVKWLSENIPQLEKKIIKYDCDELEIYKKNVVGEKISIVFPASHINSPASMYGHTFLKIDDGSGSSLLSNALNYAAQTDETNGFIFAYKGLFGGYEGQFSILPYYKKIKEYNNLENRDIWEYEIDLNKEEIDKLLLHAFELRDTFSYYYFTLENCSYNLLWLFEVAKSDLEYVRNFKIQAVPIDTIKLLDKYGLIKSSYYRFSKMKKIKTLMQSIKNKSHLKKFILEDEEILLENLTLEDKAYYFDLKIEYLLYLRSKNKISHEEYTKKYLFLLAQRSKIDYVSNLDIKIPKNPLYSHDSSKIEFALGSDNSYRFSVKPVYSDLYDVIDGNLQGAFIDFFKLDFVRKNEENNLSKFTFLNIESYSPINLLFNPISWGIEVAYEKKDLKYDYFKLSPKIGYTISNENEYAYFMLKSNVYQNKTNLSSLGVDFGLVSNRFNDMKLGLLFNRDYYNHGDIVNNYETFITYKFTKNISLNLKYLNSTNDEERSQLGIFYYF